MSDEQKKPLNRRKFLIRAAAVAGVGAAGLVGYKLVRRYKNRGHVDPTAVVGGKRRLGRTGLMVSPVGIGAGDLGDPQLLVRAAEKNINYLDTSVCYGQSEDIIGRALRESPGLRDKLILATKWDAGALSPKEKMLESLDKSLKRLGVDVIDIMQIHWLGGGHMKDDTGFNRLDNPALYEAMAEAKKSGKVRFFGATSHDGKRSEILQHAIDKGSFDMLLVKMNYLDFEGARMPALLKKAKEADVGVVVMKSQADGGNVPAGFEGSQWNIFQANLRWVLQQDVACVVHSGIGSDPHMQDLAIGASSETLSQAEADLLERYAAALSPEYCRGCGDTCQSACPESIAIASVLHYTMYEKRYGRTELARHLYGALPAGERWSETCLDCNRCAEACPFGLEVPARITEAKTLLG
jgi:uncharacterized protein